MGWVLMAFLGIFFGAVLSWLFLGRKKEEKENGAFLMLQKQLEDIRNTMDSKLGDFQKQVGETDKSMQQVVRDQFSESQKLLQNISNQMTKELLGVTKGVTEVTESTKQIFNVADQLQNLEKVLKNQKQRGNLGEAGLALCLENVLPPDAYELQYTFPDGDVVDAIIKTKDGLIPVDAKFSLENYSRVINEKDEQKKALLEKEFTNDLKRRINETAKYIKPCSGTLNIAFMFIPAEAIYYDLLVNEIGGLVRENTRSILDYAQNEKNVTIVSPTTFAAYLRVVLFGYRAFQIEKSIEKFTKHVELLKRHMKAYEDYFNRVGKSIGTTVNHYNAASKEFKKIDKDVLRITGEGVEAEVLTIDKPEES